MEVEHLTARVLRRQIKALEKVCAEEKIDRSAALRQVLEIGLKEYSKRKAVEHYRRGRLSVGRAAQDAGVSMAEFYNLLVSEGIPIKVDSEAIKAALCGDFGALDK